MILCSLVGGLWRPHLTDREAIHPRELDALKIAKADFVTHDARHWRDRRWEYTSKRAIGQPLPSLRQSILLTAITEFSNRVHFSSPCSAVGT
jgi:hypothetical protein